MSRIVWFFAAIAILGVAIDPAQADEQKLKVEMLAPWDGATRFGFDSEIGIRVSAQSISNLTLNLKIGQIRAKAEFSPPSKAAQTLWIPYRPRPDEPVTVGLRDGEEKYLRRHKLRAPVGLITAVVMADTPANFRWLSNRPEVTVIAAAPSVMPRTLHGYDQVDIVVVGVSELARLEPRQLAAFQDNLGLCGRVVVVGPVHETASLFSKTTGCGGAFYRSVALVEDAAAAAGALLERRPVKLPGGAQLREITNDDGATSIFTSVNLFLLFYTVAIIAACVNSRRVAPVIIIPIASVAVAVLVWYGRTPDLHMVVWSEAESGAAVMRYTAALGIKGRGIGAFNIPVPATAVPTLLPDNAMLHISMDSMGQQIFSIQMEAHLFTNNFISLHEGSYGSAAPLIEWENARPVVRNFDDAASPSLMLAWDGLQYLTPSLASRMVWRPKKPSKTVREDVAAQLFKHRHKAGTGSLLAAGAPPSLQLDDGKTSLTAWRMITSNPRSREKRR